MSNSSPSPPPKLKAILFDVDGTMADTDVYHRRVFFDILKPFGIHCDDAFYNEHISGKANRELHKELVPHLSPAEGEQFFITKEDKFRELSEKELQPLPGLLHFIRTVEARGIRVAAVSNAPKPNVIMMLHKFGLASEEHPISAEGCEGREGKLHAVVLGDDCKESKPSPVPYQVGMERLGVRPEECIVFEDSSSGVTAGVRAGCQVVGVLTTKDEMTMKKLGCYAVIHDYTQIDIDKMIYEMKDYVH